MNAIKLFYGPTCMPRYFNALDGIKGGTLFYYNGSRFDAFLHLRAMIESKREIITEGFVKVWPLWTN